VKLTFPLHIHISTLFLLLILLAGGLIGGVGFAYSRHMLETAAADITGRIGRQTVDKLDALVNPAEVAIDLARFAPLADPTIAGERFDRLAFMKAALDGSESLSSIYVGRDDGDFFLLRRVRDDDERLAFNAPEGTRYIAQSIVSGRGRYTFLDERLAALRSDDRPEYAGRYDPRTRAWYTRAMAAEGAIKTPPYLFFSNHKVGMTIAERLSSGGGVIGTDILLETLSNELRAEKVTPHTMIALTDASGYVLAYSGDAELIATADGPPGEAPSLRQLDQFGALPLNAAATIAPGPGAAAEFSTVAALADGNWQIHLSPVPLQGLPPLRLVIAVPETELLATAMAIRSTSAWITLAIIALTLPIAWFTARAISQPLRALAREAEAVRRFEFGRPLRIRSRVREVADLTHTVGGMKRTIRRFLDISQAVAAEADFDRLLPMLLRETLDAAEAEAGILFLIDHGNLIPASAFAKDGTPLDGLHPVETDEAGPLLRGAIAAAMPCTAILEPADTIALGLAVAATHALATPLCNRQHQLVGVLLLLREAPFTPAQTSFVGALSGSATSSLETRELIKSQKDLFEAFIQLIARAIDAKSPYTGGHCARVPELTKMLARAACDATEGPYAHFHLNADEWEALHVAGWLHDCGKITTPDYVVDKATKLETITDRIHEVRMRFEVLKRDATIAALEAVAAGADAAEAHARRDAELAALDADFAFVAACNQGGEAMADADVARLHAIAARTWTRTLDDRLGVSHEEAERKARTPAPTLPVLEPLLADKPDHRFSRRAEERIAADNPWGFRMEVPELLYDRGELHNLTVARGTLSTEERYKINEHIVQTIIMLSQLPFPKHLRAVPELAGGHHEKMDGTGYPKRLNGGEMSPQARMMAIADIFEALTAVDRPYKEGKTLSQSLRIMSFMVKDRHIDPELFALFLRSGVYRDYALHYLRPEQIDAVNIEDYLPPAPMSVL
jgi:HD-GYP domain-containing protein (c-di-GMP phosphodiesterase class II)